MLFRRDVAYLARLAAQEQSDKPRFLESWAAGTDRARQALLTSEGLEPVRHYYTMVRPDLENIPDLPLPAGVEVRPALPEHYRQIWEANTEAFADHFGSSLENDPTLEQWLANQNFDPALWRVAWAGDQVVGMVLSYIDRDENQATGRLRGWTEEICVRKPWRKQGIARALIARSLQAIKERGMTEAALGVDTQNETGALRLYEAMGYQPVKRASQYRKPI
jgi:mycothiol synthase